MASMTKTRLPFEIGLLLVAKLVALTVLYYAFFSPAHQSVADTGAVAARVLSSNSHP
jgi:hypothetical protein